MDMCKALEDLVAEGIERGERQKLKNQVEKKLSKGYSEEEIADMLEEDVQVIQELVNEIATEKKNC